MEVSWKPRRVGFLRRSSTDRFIWGNGGKKLWAGKLQIISGERDRGRRGVLDKWRSKSGDNWIWLKLDVNKDNISDNKIRSFHGGRNKQRVLADKQKRNSRHFSDDKLIVNKKVHRRVKTIIVQCDYLGYAMRKEQLCRKGKVQDLERRHYWVFEKKSARKESHLIQRTQI